MTINTIKKIKTLLIIKKANVLSSNFTYWKVSNISIKETSDELKTRKITSLKNFIIDNFTRDFNIINLAVSNIIEIRIDT